MIGYTLPEIRRLLVSLVQRLRPRPRERLVLVPLAPATPVPGPAMPLPATRLRTDLSARCGIEPESPPVSPACPR